MLNQRETLKKETIVADGMITGPVGNTPEGLPGYAYGGGADYGQMRIVNFNTQAIQNYYKGLSSFWGNTNKSFNSMLGTYHAWEKWKFGEEQEILKYTMNLMNSNPELANEMLTKTERDNIKNLFANRMKGLGI